MRFLLCVTFISHAITTAADILYEDCSGFPTNRMPRNETVIVLPCHHWPSIHRMANQLWLNPGMFTKMTLTTESMAFLNRMALSKNLTTVGNEANQSQLSQTMSGSSDALDITWDIIFQCTLKRKSKYVLVFSNNDSGINIKDYLSQSVNTTMEIQFVTCRHMPLLHKHLSYPCVFVACDITQTRAILRTAIRKNLITESYSWIILRDDTTTIDDLLDKTREHVIDDLILINHANYLAVSVSRKISYNSSTLLLKSHRGSTGYATRFSKPCREAAIVKRTEPLSKTQEMENLMSHIPPKTLSGCNVTVLLLQIPPLSSMDDTNSPHGIDYEFLALAHGALGPKVTYNLVQFQDGIDMALTDDPLTAMEDIGHFDVGIPLFGTDDETLNLIMEYTMPFVESSFSFIVRTIPKSFSGENAFKVFILPFASTVWWLVLTICFATTLAWTLVRRYHTSHRVSCISSVWESSFDIASIMPGQGVWDVTTATSFKVVLATISIFTLINLNCYSAKIIAFLTDTRPTLPFTTIQGFLERDDYGFATEYEQRYIHNSELYKVLHNTKSSALTGLCKKRFVTTTIGKDFSELPNHIGKNVYVMLREVCDFLAITNAPHMAHPFKGVFIASKKMPIRLTFPHKKLYFDIFKRLHEAGIYNKIRSKEMYKLQNIDNRRQVEVAVTAIELAAVSLLFEWLLIGIILSLIALVIEKKLT